VSAAIRALGKDYQAMPLIYELAHMHSAAHVCVCVILIGTSVSSLGLVRASANKARVAFVSGPHSGRYIPPVCVEKDQIGKKVKEGATTVHFV